MSQLKQQQIPAPVAGNGTDTGPRPVEGPKTFIDPAADTVLRSRDGRDFRVDGWMINANCTKLRDQVGSEIALDASRKVLKLVPNLMHNIPMPASFVWSMHNELFALCDEMGANGVAQIALISLCSVVELDPWGMFVLASQRNHFALARAALSALAASENKLRAQLGMNGTNGMHMNGYMYPHMHGNSMPPYGTNGMPYPMYPGWPGMGMGMGMMGQGHNGGYPMGHNSHHSHMLKPEQKKGKKKNAKALGAGDLDYASLNLIMSKAGNSDASISMPFLVSMMNSLLTSAAGSGTEINWEDVARNFKPTETQRASSKQVAKADNAE
ncbi:hypothetical protein CcaverHIS002_0500870 [Cutaneotrichosporon cavernicola]|uniref:Uncharacterized protein n=1 Tax=Cutaneotrichosporon cavernicola TaxID=279322 RepID=A0AA48L840_9TREE|nr:uncharacterized protein CcaverHIS019_0600870 [Cutaneotrichosporon cavernicola]BEI84686.1 hypothetical protein CcaverHIS002_0500870 [Cutaneotrichosporon cavernicola]BEI93628.1 hypothetical protein CcaverHIS019_0600870 [Cutaneotrichosporon cavernicola]BEJ01405.1 hypothetical protein CcaverHIS631_0600870 [Cutaneotrichosporon cavernicola]BEJ09172.1 hypothetical protein CcaverHIS641_0600870 [Cutaneotrichosporon cavernicola]